MKNGTCIDTNFISYVAKFKLQDVSQWLDNLYEEIIIAPKVLDELLYLEGRDYCEKMIGDRRWRLINPLNSSIETQYLMHYQQVQQDFAQFQSRRNYKQTSDKADMQILALCLTLDLPLITSNDGDFKKVIEQYDYRISVGESLEADEELIQVDGLLEFALKCKNLKVAKPSLIRKFININAPDGQKEMILARLKD